MLPARHRMVRPEDFRAARRGTSAKTDDLVVQLADAGTDCTRVGFVVPKKQIARATHRTRVKRRLRHLCAARLTTIAPGSLLVVRVAAGADGKSSADLGAQLDKALAKIARKNAARAGAACPSPAGQAL